MDENVINLLMASSSIIGALLTDVIFLGLAAISGLVWMFAGQALRHAPAGARIGAQIAGTLIPIGIYLALRLMRGPAPEDFEALMLLVAAMFFAFILVMAATLGLLAAGWFLVALVSGKRE